MQLVRFLGPFQGFPRASWVETMSGDRPSKVAKTVESIEEIAKAWLEIDYVPQTKKLVQDLLDAGDKPVRVLSAKKPHAQVMSLSHCLLKRRTQESYKARGLAAVIILIYTTLMYT